MFHSIKYFILFFVVIFFSIVVPLKADPVINAYDSYLEALGIISSLEELEPYMSQNQMGQLEKMDDDQKSFALTFIKEIHRNMERQSISSNVTGSNATLTLEVVDTSTNKPSVGTITMIKENGSWKVEKEKYAFK